MPNRFTAVSLFSSGGIGDLACRSQGWDVLVSNELLPDRAAVFKHNHPNSKMIVGDIRYLRDRIVSQTNRSLGSERLDVILATPPCQGMSKNGMGKLLREWREGRRPSLDERNQLVIPVVELVEELQPRALLMENVPEMGRTIIETDEGLETIEGFLKRRLMAIGYSGGMQIVEFADYGVPQRRKRLITLFVLDGGRQTISDQWLPLPTHSPEGGLLCLPWVTVMDKIGALPGLDARSPETAASDHHPLHRVPVLDDSKYFWVSNTPPGQTAFDNQCVAEDCRSQATRGHGTARNEAGVNRAVRHTPIRCSECGALLPRPWTIKEGQHVLMSGFTSAYKRMRGDLPASALTRNLSYACSDQKLHPTQNRVLSLHEAEILHTIVEYDWAWRRSDGKHVSDKLIREIIGESVPPKGLEIILEKVRTVVASAEINQAAA